MLAVLMSVKDQTSGHCWCLKQRCGRLTMMFSEVNYEAHRVSSVSTQIVMIDVLYLKQLSESNRQGVRHDGCSP